MKFVIPTQEFNYLISKCLNVVSAKAAVPILSNLLIEASSGMIRVTATDLSVGIRCFAEVEIIEEGATTLPARKLAQLIKELTTPNIEIYCSPNHITEITAGTSKFRLLGMDKAPFPSLPDLGDVVKFTVKERDLKEAIFRTAFAVSKEEARYTLSGVWLSISGGKAILAGTDGKRLARAILPIENAPDLTGTYIIPIKAVDEILKNLREEGDVTLYLLEDKIAVQTQDALIVSKLLSGEFPDINRIIPLEANKLISLHREELMTLLRQIALFTSENNNVVRIVLENGEMSLGASANEVGEGKVSMPANYYGDRFEIAFNPSYFLDVLRHSKNETVSLGVSDPFTPGIVTDAEITSYAPENLSPLFVLMPMRLKEV